MVSGGLGKVYLRRLDSQHHSLRLQDRVFDHSSFLRGSSNSLPRNPLKQAAIQQGIQELLLKNAISLVPQGELSMGFFSIIFLVQMVSSGFRMVLDLKRLNKYIPSVRFKMETLQQIFPLISQNHCVHWICGMPMITFRSIRVIGRF